MVRALDLHVWSVHGVVKRFHEPRYLPKAFYDFHETFAGVISDLPVALIPRSPGAQSPVSHSLARSSATLAPYRLSITRERHPKRRIASRLHFATAADHGVAVQSRSWWGWSRSIPASAQRRRSIRAMPESVS